MPGDVLKMNENLPEESMYLPACVMNFWCLKPLRNVTRPHALLGGKRRSLKQSFFFKIRQKATYDSLELQSLDLYALKPPAEPRAVLAGDSYQTQPQFSSHLTCLLSLAADLIPALVCSFSSISEASLQPSVKLCCVN